MPLWVLVLMIVGITTAMFFYLGPLQVLTRQQFIVSHLFIIAGVLIVIGYLLLQNLDQPSEVTMIMGGIWTLAGGICFGVVYVSRQLKKSIDGK